MTTIFTYIPCKLLFAAALLLGASPSFANGGLIDSASFEGGVGDQIRMLRVGAQSDWSARWFDSNGTHLSGYWDATLAQWRGTRYRDVPGASQDIVDIGITPVFRFENNSKRGFYAEAGVAGLHRLSALYDNNGRRLSTLFEFGDHLGLGYVLDAHWEIGMKVQHFSNGGIKKPNSGVNWFEVKAGYHF